MELHDRYASEVDVDFVRKSIKAIGQTAIKIDEAAERCVNVLLDLIATRVSYVVQEAVVVMKVRPFQSDFSLQIHHLQTPRIYSGSILRRTKVLFQHSAQTSMNSMNPKQRLPSFGSLANTRIRLTMRTSC